MPADAHSNDGELSSQRPTEGEGRDLSGADNLSAEEKELIRKAFEADDKALQEKLDLPTLSNRVREGVLKAVRRSLDRPLLRRNPRATRQGA